MNNIMHPKEHLIESATQNIRIKSNVPTPTSSVSLKGLQKDVFSLRC